MQEQIKKKLQDEMNLLEHELNHELPKELKKAVALGDLSENAEYHMAKQRQEYLKARIRQLGKRLADLSLINMNNIPKDKVGLGSTVTVFDGTKNEEMEYQLVTSEESDVAAGKILAVQLAHFLADELRKFRDQARSMAIKAAKEKAKEKNPSTAPQKK